MNDNIFEDFKIKRSSYNDQIFSMFGRALYVSSVSEMNVKSLDMLFSVLFKLKPENDFDVFINNISAKIEKGNLNSFINNIFGSEFGKDEKFEKTLHDARKARNEVIHESTKSIKYLIDNDENRFIVDMRNNIKIIANANMKTALLINKLTNEPIPNHDSIKNYAENTVNWVCNIILNNVN